MGYKFAVLLFCSLLVAGCRTADWHLQKAIQKGAKLDTARHVVKEYVTIASLQDSGSVSIDTAKLRSVCAELLGVTFDNSFEDSKVVAPLELLPSTGELVAAKKSAIKKIQREVCPQVDNVYWVPVTIEDSTYRLPITLQLAEGKYKLKTADFKIAYVKLQTDVELKTTKGYTLWNLIAAGLTGFTLGAIGALILVLRK